MYLLDVNALLALGFDKHVHHWRTMEWLAHCADQHAPDEVRLATCSITELGFVRVASGSTGLASSLKEAQLTLQRLRSRFHVVLFADDLDANSMPPWVTRSKQTTDGHLLMLARTRDAHFVTLDEDIPGAILIPQLPGPLSCLL